MEEAAPEVYKGYNIKTEEYHYYKLWIKDKGLMTERNQYVLFMKKLLLLGQIEDDDYDRQVGNYYGYNKCCIDNFINLCKKGYDAYRYMKTLHAHPQLGGKVLCQKCLQRWFNERHKMWFNERCM